MSVNTDIWELLILRKKVKPSHFHDAFEIGSICFMLEWKSFSDSQRSEVFYDILFDHRSWKFGSYKPRLHGAQLPLVSTPFRKK